MEVAALIGKLMGKLLTSDVMVVTGDPERSILRVPSGLWLEDRLTECMKGIGWYSSLNSFRQWNSMYS